MEYIGFFYNLLFALVGLVGALLFTWWWVTIGRSSDIYAYITFFMYGVFVTQSVSLYARHLVWHGGIGPHEAGACWLLSQWWFIFRTLPEFLAVGAIVCTMVVRTVVIIRNSRIPRKKKFERRAFPSDFPHPRDNPFVDTDEPHDPRFP